MLVLWGYPCVNKPELFYGWCCDVQFCVGWEMGGTFSECVQERVSSANVTVRETLSCSVLFVSLNEGAARTTTRMLDIVLACSFWPKAVLSFKHSNHSSQRRKNMWLFWQRYTWQVIMLGYKVSLDNFAFCQLKVKFILQWWVSSIWTISLFKKKTNKKHTSFS